MKPSQIKLDFSLISGKANLTIAHINSLKNAIVEKTKQLSAQNLSNEVVNTETHSFIVDFSGRQLVASITSISVIKSNQSNKTPEPSTQTESNVSPEMAHEIYNQALKNGEISLNNGWVSVKGLEKRYRKAELLEKIVNSGKI